MQPDEGPFTKVNLQRREDAERREDDLEAAETSSRDDMLEDTLSDPLVDPLALPPPDPEGDASPAPGDPATPGEGTAAAPPPGQPPVQQTVQFIDENEGEEEETVRPLDADMIDISGHSVSNVGTVTATVAGSEAVIQSSDLTASATATLRLEPGEKVSEGVEVGVIQTVVHSERRAIYRWGGVPGGRETEVVERVVNARDAMLDPQDPSKDHPRAYKPWYLRATNRLAGSGESASLQMNDQPRFSAPLEKGPGKLVGTAGTDRFVFSYAAKQGSTIIHKQRFEWTVPWTLDLVTLEGNNPVVGAEGASIHPTNEVPRLDGKVAREAGAVWMRFPTVADADGFDTPTLLGVLPTAQVEDPQSAANIVAALDARNPAINITLKVASTAEWFGSDEVQLTVAGAQSATRGPFSLNSGDSKDTSCNLLDLFASAGSIGSGSTITFTAQDTGTISNDAVSTTWPTPFHGVIGRTMDGAAADYEISMAFSR